MTDIVSGIAQSLFGSGDVFSLLLLALKLVALLFIISFVRNRFGNSWFATALTFVLAYVMLFQAWSIFGPIIIMYMFIVFGFTGLLFDLAISKPWAGSASDSASRKAMQEKTGKFI